MATAVRIEPTGHAEKGAPNRSDQLAERLALAREAYRERRQRDRFFPGGTFAEPTWDILLDLFIREGEGRSTPVSSACIAARVPCTTGLRYIAVLTGAGLVRRTPNPIDSRSSLLELTPPAAAMMRDYLSHIALMRDAGCREA